MADTVRRTNYYVLTVPDEPGEGARVLESLRDAGVDLMAFHAFPEGGRAQLDLVPKDEGRLAQAARDAGLELSGPKTAFLVQGDDRPGAVAELLGKLAGEGVNVTAMDAVCTDGRYGALFWVKPADVDRAAAAVGAA